MLMTILLLLLVLTVIGAGWRHSRWGYAGWSPVGLILTVLLIMWFTGHLHR